MRLNNLFYKFVFIVIVLVTSFGEIKAQCNTNTSICTPGTAGPFNFVTSGTPVSSCLDFFGPNTGYIILHITTSGPLNMLIDGNAGSGFLDVAVFNIPPGQSPCTAIQNQANEIGCNYANSSAGCNQFGTAFPCAASVPAPNVTAGQELMIVVDNWSGTSNNFTLTLGPAPGAQTGPPNATITPAGPFCSNGSSQQLIAADMGGTWSGPGVSSTGMFNPATAGVGTHTINYSVGVAPCNASSSTTVTVTAPAPLTVTPTTTTICRGQSVNLTASLSGAAGYSWSPSGTLSPTTGASVTATPTATTTYVVTANAGCGNQTAQAIVNVNPLPILTTSSTTAACSACNGTATVNASGATGTYTYAWSPSGGTGATASGLCGGSYTATVTSAAGCVSTATVNVPATTAITTSVTGTNILCNGSTTGTATATAAGGTTPYTYLWSNGGTTSTISGLAAGTYNVTVTSANGCTATGSVTITQPPALTTTGSQVNLLCNSAGTGSATVTASGGTGPYTYAWSPSGGTGNTASGLAAGTYTVTVTDANGCAVQRSYTITEPAVLTASNTTTPSSCGAANGSATVTASGGTGALTYSWSPSGGTGTTASNLVAGAYTATVTDANGCTVTTTASVSNTGAPTATITATTHVLCNGDANGSATVSASGGTGTLTYSWSPSGGNGTTASGLSGGTYSVNVTDANGCTANASATINESPAIVLSTSSVSATCGNSNGSATVTATGGTGTLTYSWNPSGGTASTATGLAPATYSVTVTDANGCSETASVTVTNSGGPAVSIGSFTDITCNGANDGSATVSVSGGVGTLTYSWSPSGATTATASGLGVGSHTVTVTDGNGCSSTATAVIAEPAALVSSISLTGDVTCNGASNGSATATVTGGTGTYTYSWSPSGGNTLTATGLGAGSYTINITDANGCSTSSTAVINEPVALTITTSGINASCNGGSNGAASVTASGGTGVYTYSWSPVNGSGTSITSLTAGTYSVTVTDANGCLQNGTVVISEPSALVLTTSTTSSTCGSANGTATVSATGGTGSYTYSWTPAGGNAATATGLNAGTYTVSVTDANGCSQSGTATVTNSGGPVVSITSSTNVSCNGGADGSATASVSGGTGAMTYSWSPSGGNSATATGLGSGFYTISATDANGCIDTDTITITEPAVLVSSITSSTNVSCFGGTDGEATVLASGGTGTYTYTWSPSGGTSSIATGLSAGSYTVTVNDGNGCATSSIATITEPTILAVTTSGDDADCNGSSDGSIATSVTGGTGSYTYSWSPVSGSASTLTNLAAGTYSVLVTDENGCPVTGSYTINEPAALVLTTSSVQSTCGDSNGSATVTAVGGTGIYTYSWSPSGGNSDVATGLLAATYTVYVTDANGCQQSATETVVNAGSPSVSIVSSVNASCYSAADGSATASASGGTGIYTYSWLPSGGNNAIASSLVAGTYTVAVADGNGCIDTAMIVITEPDELLSSISSTTNVDCNGAANGAATVAVSGGTGQYTYSWSPSGGNSSTATGLSPASYTVTINDQNNCTTFSSVTITEPSLLTVSLSGIDVTCNLGNNGSASATASGGSGTYTYSWSPVSGSTSSLNSLTAGTYSVTVTDSLGCQASDNIVITEPTALNASICAFTDALCFQSCDGTAKVCASGGTGTYTYAWNTLPVQTADSASGLCAGIYEVTVMDANGCNIKKNVTIDDPEILVVNAVDPGAICIGETITLTANTSGGTVPYVLSWQPSGPSVSPVDSATYIVFATDDHGCISANDTVLVPVRDSLRAIASMDETICPGEGANVSVAVTGGDGNYSYTWTPVGTDSAFVATPLTTTLYVVTVADGCSTPLVSDSVKITVAPLPIVSFQPFQASGCVPFCTDFMNMTDVGNALISNWAWDFGDGTTSSDAFPVNKCFNDPGSYSIQLTGTTTEGCTVITKVDNQITAHALPVAEFSHGPIDATSIHGKVCFTDASIIGTAWEWNFGDSLSGEDNFSEIQNPCHEYKDTGSYKVTLVVHNIEGCTDTIIHYVIISPEFTFYIPSAFTPNKDGLNDEFTASASFITEYDMLIFDRWGSKIFHSTDIERGWDGTANNGNEVSMQDVYIYVITITDFLGKKHQYKGPVTLVK